MSRRQCDGLGNLPCTCWARYSSAKIRCECPPCPGCETCRAEAAQKAEAAAAEYRRAKAVLDAAEEARTPGPRCDGSGKLPCEACGGAGSIARPHVAPGLYSHYMCTACMGKRHAGRCPGCEACKARKGDAAAKGSGQPRLFE